MWNKMKKWFKNKFVFSGNRKSKSDFHDNPFLIL
jgi:hypothetical protein